VTRSGREGGDAGDRGGSELIGIADGDRWRTSTWS